MRLVIKQAGDTIIEVMLAFVVFAMLAVGAINVMNSGVASAQEALETTLVREEIDGQAETLRFLHQAYMVNPGSTDPTAANFRSILTRASDSSPSQFGAGECLTATPGINPFVVNPRNGDVIDGTRLHPVNHADAPAYARLVYHPDETFRASFGVWIEAIKGDPDESAQPTFIDFHIRACWYSVTSDAPRTLGTIVRLYVPQV